MPLPPRLQLQHITKRYPGVVANDDVSLTVQPGEIHAVLGENGAGKSTLMKIIYGAVQPDSGVVHIDGERVYIRNPHMARERGISMVFQHFSLFDTLTVAENVWLGLSKQVSLAEVQQRIAAKAAEYGLELDAARPVHTLSVGERQRVEIIRALLTHPRLLILDEPTSVLTPAAVDKLFVTLNQLSATGCSILYISHKLDEIRTLCHNCTVLRGGRVAGVVDPTQQSEASLSRLMIGEQPPALEHRHRTQGALALQVQGLTLQSEEQFGTDLHDINLSLYSGEIIGISGISGSGQQELLKAVSGEDVRIASDAITLFGQRIAKLNPQARRALGLHFVPEERLGRGAVPVMSLALNTLLTRNGEPAVGPLGWLRPQAARQTAGHIISRFGVKASGVQAAAKSLSGGNLQKFIVGREISAAPKVLVVSQPTWGVDVGAAAQIRAELLKLRDAGCAVLVVSEEIDELFELSDRIYVMAKGRLSPPIARADATVEQIGQWMSGLWSDASTPDASIRNTREVRHAAA